ncbi:hypothetical protein GCM10028826_28750 [Mucilaginibacter boryungensis]
MVSTEDVMAESWPALNAAQLGYNFTSTQDFENYVYNASGLTAIELYYIRQATVTIGSNNVQDAINANHPVLASHYSSTNGYSYVVIIGYDSAGYTYSDPVNGGLAYDTFSNFTDELEITGVI